MLNSEVIARMLLSGLTTINTTLGYDNTTTEMAKKFLSAHSERASSEVELSLQSLTPLQTWFWVMQRKLSQVNSPSAHFG